MKPPEEGEIWEWRAFGRIPHRLAALVRARPIRMGVSDHTGEDVYLISPASDHNVKLRRSEGRWILKFKLLLATAQRSIELYRESASLIYNFPTGRNIIEEAASLLCTELPASVAPAASFEAEEFVEAMAGCSPPVVKIEAVKVRSQFQFELGWVELAHVRFSRHLTQSLSIHSPHVEAVEEMLDTLRPGPELEAMNYVEACRRWG
ncbi:MAG: hypothetical protein L0229_23785 [Blastocatellia bacterium]|nr:hypothetical protein [Blastocatellia bacterium]